MAETARRRSASDGGDGDQHPVHSEKTPQDPVGQDEEPLVNFWEASRSGTAAQLLAAVAVLKRRHLRSEDEDGRLLEMLSRGDSGDAEGGEPSALYLACRRGAADCAEVICRELWAAVRAAQKANKSSKRSGNASGGEVGENVIVGVSDGVADDLEKGSLDSLLPFPQHKSGWRSVHAAALYGHIGCIRVLAKHRCDMFSSPPGFNFGGSPRDFADVEKHYEITKFLDELEETRRREESGSGSGSDVSSGVLVMYGWTAASSFSSSSGDVGLPFKMAAMLPPGQLPLVFRLRKSTFQESGLGWTVWPAASVMGRWLFEEPEKRLERLIRGRRILELGCGPGLLSLLAIRHGAAAVTATDVNHALLDLVMANASENGVDQGTLRTQVLEWKDVVDGRATPPADFDLILGSDLIYGDTMSRTLARVLSLILPASKPRKEDRTFVGCMQKNRTGVAEFPMRCELMGLSVATEEVHPRLFQDMEDPPGWVVFHVSTGAKSKREEEEGAPVVHLDDIILSASEKSS